jgi:restriction endonuclease Mrr
MGVPSSQIASIWLRAELESTTWVPVRDVLFKTIKRKVISYSDEEAWDFVEVNCQYVAEHLRDVVAEFQIDGTIPTFEIDSEQTPYIRLTAAFPSDVVAKLRKIDPFQLESICAKLLSALGASSYATQRTNDGGIDFVGVDLKIVPLALTIPRACRAAVIGQAKRYKEGNPISETKVREFVGAATLKRHKLAIESKIGCLAPVLYAFWTTSDFDPNAKKYARELGLWYMDGSTLATYVTDLGLKDFVMSLPDDPTYAPKPIATAVEDEQGIAAPVQP